MGLSPSSSLDIIDEYPEEDVNWFVSKLQNQYQAQVHSEDIRWVNNMLTALGASNSKKGIQNYQRWRIEKVNIIDDLSREKTVFERLKESKANSITVFDRLKSMRK